MVVGPSKPGMLMIEDKSKTDSLILQVGDSALGPPGSLTIPLDNNLSDLALHSKSQLCEKAKTS